VITCYLFIKIAGIVSVYTEENWHKDFFEDILVSDRIINRIQYKLVLEENYNYALQLVSYKNCIEIYICICTYIYGFKCYVLLMNLSLKLIGVIFKKI